MLRRRDAGESDRRLTILTQELGIIDAIAKGARKPASRLAGASEPITASIFGIAAGRSRFVTQVQPVSSFPGIRSDYDRVLAAQALCELAVVTLPHEHEASSEFSLLVTALAFLDSGAEPILWLIWSELKLMALVGFRPEWYQCAVRGTEIEESPCWVSAQAGGYVSPEAASDFSDRFQVRAEVIYGVRAVTELDQPPGRLKFAVETIQMLVKLWESMTEGKLQANRQFASNTNDFA